MDSLRGADVIVVSTYIGIGGTRAINAGGPLSDVLVGRDAHRVIAAGPEEAVS